MSPAERGRKLQEAADAFVKVRAELRTLASSDPEVTRLRQEAEQQLSLGAFDTARATLAEAADIDGRSRQALKENFIGRTVSEATTHYLAGGAALADLRYQLAIADYEKAAALYAEVEGFDLSDDDRYQHALMLELIGTMQMTLGNLPAAGDAYRRMEAAAERRSTLKPANLQWQRDLAVAKDKVADVLYARAISPVRSPNTIEARAIIKQLVEADPGNARMAARSFGQLQPHRRSAPRLRRLPGRARRLPHRAAGGRDPGRASIPTMRAGASTWRSATTRSAMRCGSPNDLAGALASFEVSLSLDETLVAHHPDNADYQRHSRSI